PETPHQPGWNSADGDLFCPLRSGVRSTCRRCPVRKNELGTASAWTMAGATSDAHSPRGADQATFLSALYAAVCSGTGHSGGTGPGRAEPDHDLEVLGRGASSGSDHEL